MRLKPRKNPEVLFLMATASEYGPHLRKKIAPLIIGIGPVEAAVNTTAHLSALAAADRLPDLVVSLGSAGSRRLKQTEIYQVASIFYRDMDISVLGFEKGCNPLLELPATIDLPCLSSRLPCASLSTGGDMVSDTAYDAISADMVDMETFALWRACQKFAIPLIGLRGISDGDAELRQVSDWKDSLGIIDKKLCQALDEIEASIGGWRHHTQPRV